VKNTHIPVERDVLYMKRALKIAYRARERTFPNPMVGAVIVKDNKVVSEGFHKRPGMPHAEAEALRKAGWKCPGGTMYVTLEPCSSYGRTPPCTKAILESGISDVVVGTTDPNPVNGGKGIKQLRGNGISVRTGICEKECVYMNRKYFKYMREGTPYVTLKIAESLDGKIAASDGTSKWITSEGSRKYSRNMRKELDAIVVGSNTVKIDDPFLLGPEGSPIKATRVVLDTRCSVTVDHRIIRTAGLSPVLIVVTDKASSRDVKKLSSVSGVEVLKMPEKNGTVDLGVLLPELGRRSMVNILVEGGGRVISEFVDNKLYDEIMVFIAPKILGGEKDAVRGIGAKNIKEASVFHNVRIERIGGDILFKGTVRAY
jgi:diaminohydroxyphosphoribosylaminopyrimidine deaminase/5-amino-6-(5-phosphoribosylamino)uracil reductase